MEKGENSPRLFVLIWLDAAGWLLVTPGRCPNSPFPPFFQLQEICINDVLQSKYHEKMRGGGTKQGPIGSSADTFAVQTLKSLMKEISEKEKKTLLPFPVWTLRPGGVEQ